MVTGVTRQYAYPPLLISTADLPASFVRPPSSGFSQIATCDPVGDTFSTSLVIAIEPAGQEIQATNYAALLTMLDNLNTALKAAAFTDTIRHSWTLSAQDTQPIIVGGSAYWGVTATITAQGAN